MYLTPLAPDPQKYHTHSNISSGKAVKLSECVWPFCGAGA